MDYSQSQNIQPGQPIPQDFFTAGSGTNNEEINNFEPENNLASTNSQAGWDALTEAYPGANQQLGQQAIQSIDFPQAASQSANAAPNLGEVVTLDMPPAKKDAPLVMVSDQSSLDPIQATQITEDSHSDQLNTPEDRSKIKTSDTLSDDAIEAMRRAEKKLEQDGDIVNFYDFIRDSMEDNLKNSYNRKLAA